MRKTRLGWAILVLMALILGARGEGKPSDAILKLLNSRAAGSPRGYSTAAKIVADEAANNKNQPVYKFVIALVSEDPQAPETARLDPEVRKRYLNESRDRIRQLAEKKGNSMAWYLLSLENNNTNFLKRAADGGNPQALNAWGTMCIKQAFRDTSLSTNDLERVLRRCFGYFNDAAGQKDANGFFNLGMCYLHGYGCEKDLDRAFGCFRTAAEAGHPEAINNIGGFFRDGLIVEKDYVRAAKWFFKSAELGNAYGQLNYALALQRGEGIEKDEKAAAKLLLDAAQQGCPEAMNAYGMCCFTGSGVKQDQHAAFNWFKAAAASSFPPAMENMATCYEQGKVVERSVRLATMWKLRARAARGDRNAMAWLKQNGYSLGGN